MRRESERLYMIGQVAGGIAHDFNNLLTVIINFTALAQAETGASSPAAEHLEQVRGAAEEAASLTRRLLTLGRRDFAGLRPTDLGAAIEEVKPLIARTAGEDVELSIGVAPDTWPVLADPHRLELILLNLVVNARDAMPTGGKLTVEGGNRDVGAEEAAAHGVEPGRYVRLMVEDSGRGMTLPVRAHAAEPFFTTKPAGEGLGLGLAAVNGTVQELGGWVRIDSAPGMGTAVELNLPSGDRPGVRKGPPQGRGDDATAGAILVIEDQAALRRAMAEVLETHRYEVTAIGSAERALELLAADPRPRVDLVLTDVVLPGSSGSELADRIAGLGIAVPILFMSGYADEALSSHRVGDRGVSLIRKPFTPQELLRAVSSALASAAPG